MLTMAKVFVLAPKMELDHPVLGISVEISMVFEYNFPSTTLNVTGTLNEAGTHPFRPNQSPTNPMTIFVITAFPGLLMMHLTV